MGWEAIKKVENEASSNFTSLILLKQHLNRWVGLIRRRVSQAFHSSLWRSKLLRSNRYKLTQEKLIVGMGPAFCPSEQGRRERGCPRRLSSLHPWTLSSSKWIKPKETCSDLRAAPTDSRVRISSLYACHCHRETACYRTELGQRKLLD